MNLKQILAVILLCIIGAFIAQLIPTEYKYIFGYIAGTLVNMVCQLLED